MIERQIHSEPTCRLPLPGEPAAGIASTDAPSLRRLRARTRCASLDEFVAGFARFVDDSSVFVLTPTPLAIGTELEFAFALANASVVFQGRGRVIEPSPTDELAVARTGMRLAIVELTPPSRDVHRLVLAARPSASYPHRNTVPREPTHDPEPSLPVPPSGPWEDEPTRPGTAAELAALLPARDSLPVNPLAAISEDDLSSLIEFTLHEEAGEPHDEVCPPSLDRPVSVAPLVAAAARRPTAIVALAASAAGLVLGYLLWGRSSEPPRPAPVRRPVATSRASAVPPAPVETPAKPGRDAD
jgi:hypothetical protein